MLPDRANVPPELTFRSTFLFAVTAPESVAVPVLLVATIDNVLLLDPERTVIGFARAMPFPPSTKLALSEPFSSPRLMVLVKVAPCATSNRVVPPTK